MKWTDKKPDDSRLELIRKCEAKKKERLPNVVVTEQMDDVPPPYDESQKSEAESIIAEMKSKAEADRKEMRERLNQAKEVKEKADESLYSSLFGMLVQDSVDSILKKEVVKLTMEMCRFRNNISEKMMNDEGRADAPMNIARLHEGFDEAWKIWRAGDTEEARDARGDKSYQALIAVLTTEWKRDWEQKKPVNSIFIL